MLPLSESKIGIESRLKNTPAAEPQSSLEETEVNGKSNSLAVGPLEAHLQVHCLAGLLLADRNP
jgi:hypothetical protein